MVEVISALAGHIQAGRHGVGRKGMGVILREVTGRDLVQAGWWPGTGPVVKATLERELGFALTGAPGHVSESGQTTVFSVAPDKLWIAAPLSAGLHGKLTAALPAAQGVVTELGHSRTVLRISGPSARELLARSFAIDTHPPVFPHSPASTPPVR